MPIFSHLFLTVRACVATERRASRRRRGEDARVSEPEAPQGCAFIAAIDWIALVVVAGEEGEEGKAETAALRAARRDPRVHLAAAAEVARAGIVECLIASVCEKEGVRGKGGVFERERF